ncbi:RHO1 GDP-GTP exchange protein 2 [Conglomerata obtusa]
MVNERKRLEAMSELFESEKAYVKDMKIWSITFRRFILNCASLTPQRRYLLNNLVFLNSENIADLHEKIAQELAYKNDEMRKINMPNYLKGDIFQKMVLDGVETGENKIYKDLTYVDVYEKHLHQLEIYQYYINRLPKIEYFLDKETATNNRFASELKQFLTETGYIIMGYKHFIYRPTQKLARYPLLFNAIAKNSTNESIKEQIAKVNEVLVEKTKKYDQELGQVQNYFKIYKILCNIEYKEYVEKTISTGLFIKKRKLVQISNDVYVKSRYRFEPRSFRLYLFDHMILIIHPISKIFGETYYIADDPLPLNKYYIYEEDTERTVKDTLQGFKGKIKMKEIDGDTVLTFLFKNYSQSLELKNSIKLCQAYLTSLYDPRISLRLQATIFEEKFEEICVVDKFYIGNCYCENEEQRIKNYYDEIIKIKNNENGLPTISSEEKEIVETRSNNDSQSGADQNNIGQNNLDKDFESILHTKNIFDNISDGNLCYCNQEHFLFISTINGIILKSHNRCDLIYNRKVSFLTYIHEYQIICFIDEYVCYWSHVNINTKFLVVNTICNKAERFWYGKTLEKSYIAIRVVSNTPASYLQLYELEEESGYITAQLNTQLYIGAFINQLTFFNSTIIISCPDFEVIDLSSLNTHTLINAIDPTIEWFMQHLDPTSAQNIFKIEKGLYLVCNNKVGFFVNEFGSTCEDGVFFAFYTEPLDFRLFNKYLVVISRVNMVVYSIETGEIISYIIKKGLNFVRCCSAPWVYVDDELYEITLPPLE